MSDLPLESAPVAQTLAALSQEFYEASGRPPMLGELLAMIGQALREARDDVLTDVNGSAVSLLIADGVPEQRTDNVMLGSCRRQRFRRGSICPFCHDCKASSDAAGIL